MYGLNVSGQWWSRAVVVAALLFVPLSGARAVNTYMAKITSAASSQGDGFTSTCITSSGIINSSTTQFSAAVSTINGCIGSGVPQICGVGCNDGPYTASNFTSPTTASAGAGWLWHFTASTPAAHIRDVTLNYSCPSGGSFSSSYPGWCIVNGVPPASDVCASKVGTSAGYWSIHSGETKVVDTDGCEIDFQKPEFCVALSTPYDPSPNCVAIGSYTGVTPTSSSEQPSAGDNANATSNCVQATGGAALVCQSAGQPSGCGTVNGVAFCAGDLPSNGCVSNPGGSMFCTGATTSPPLPNNGTTGTPATPDGTFSSGTNAQQSGGGGATGINYYSSSTVAASTASSSGSGTTLGYASSDLPTNDDLKGMRSDLDAIRSATSAISAASSSAPSVATGTGAANSVPGSLASDVDAAGMNSHTHSQPLLFEDRTCTPLTGTLEGVSGSIDPCQTVSLIRAVLSYLVAGLTALFCWMTWLSTSLSRTD